MAVIEGLYQSFAGLNINWLLYGTGKVFLESEFPKTEIVAEAGAPYGQQRKEVSLEELQREVEELRKKLSALEQAIKNDK